MSFFTDYQLHEHDLKPLFGNDKNKKVPIRRVELISYDGDEFAVIVYLNKLYTIRADHLYTKWGRFGEVPVIPQKDLDIVSEIKDIGQIKWLK